MLKFLIATTAALSLGACATGGDLKVSLAGMVGQPVQRAIDRLGPPAGKTDDGGGGSTYIWESNYDVQYSESPPPSTHGVGDPNDMAGSFAPGTQATTSTASSTNYRCYVRLTTGADGKIKTTAWGGNGDGCASYAQRLQ
jgi:hypothetical protein